MTENNLQNERSKTWIEQYLENYKGQSDEAKECNKFLKSNYKGDAYLPWAFMVRVMLQQDPDASFYSIKNNDDIIFYNKYAIDTLSENKDSSSRTHVDVVSPMVGISVKFLGKTFTDYYPVQDNDYSAPKAVNQNMINKAKQRCLARCISMATGIGWSLYEGKDLQFEDSNSQSPKKSAVVTVQETASPIETVKQDAASLDLEKPYEIEPPTVNLNTVSDEAKELAKFIKDYPNKQAMGDVISTLNTMCIKKYNFSFDLDDSLEVIESKSNKIASPSKFMAAVKNQLKVHGYE